MKFLIKLFIKDSENTKNPKVREKYSILSGVAGIICNIILFFVKMFSGIATGSMAIFADAFNNLSDCGSSVISVASARLSNRRPDKDHPFGHG
ncbi:MAG: cation transporter, partial [Clostridia bacterium]|nr:cation transporter [Clostridia bacterium]